MDAKSLAQVEHIVTFAVTGLRQELTNAATGLKDSQETANAELRRELAAMSGELRRAIVTTATDLRGEMADLRRDLETTRTNLHQAMIASAEEIKRFTGILFEDSQHKLDLVVEGMQFLRQSDADIRAEIAHESRETRALLKLSYEQLHSRVQTLEQRVGPAS